MPSVSLGRITAADYDKLREPLPALHLNFDTPLVPDAVLRQLGTPAAWSSDMSPAEMFAPMLRAAANEARRLALAEIVEEAHAANGEPAEARVRAKAKSPAKKKAVTTTATRKAIVRTTKSSASKAASASKAKSTSRGAARTGKLRTARALGRSTARRKNR